jgi:hypothetical protein
VSPSWLPVGVGDGVGEDDVEAEAVGDGLAAAVDAARVVSGVGRGVCLGPRARAAVPTRAEVARAVCVAAAAAGRAAEGALWVR